MHAAAGPAESIDQRVAATTAKLLGDIHPLAIHCRNNLVLTRRQSVNYEGRRMKRSCVPFLSSSLLFLPLRRHSRIAAVHAFPRPPQNSPPFRKPIPTILSMAMPAFVVFSLGGSAFDVCSQAFDMAIDPGEYKWVRRCLSGNDRIIQSACVEVAVVSFDHARHSRSNQPLTRRWMGTVSLDKAT